ncbi:NTP transferase domain-containing protein [Micromonospora sp. STR1_7]|uniref:UTP--glucose-1-phosphate uridylyltransferase n=1 Tax=Micromonospora parastrephiae TaxID=2806101 RepID=A0ABS1XMH9_9ACTN|nr:sugar phosphate nucleotidyltransferase [Micromonospora parastrephiae]MBM0230470.1 NTP transferase domain-containing protein [Micromonospora parastrephiae]
MRAVIAVAGMGSRFFPIGKTINKCMLPIFNQPVVAYAVADCVAAGAREIAIVTAPGEIGRQVRHYFTEDHDLKDYFAARGWQDKYASLADLHSQADFTFLEQPRDDRYGTALPAIVAADFIAGDDFLLVAGDDLLLRNDGGSDLADLATARAAAGVPARSPPPRCPVPRPTATASSTREQPEVTSYSISCWKSQTTTASRPPTSTSAALCYPPTPWPTSRS